MSDVKRNPASQPQDEEYEYRQNDSADYPTEIAGPGGRTVNVENNERGILDAVIERTIRTYRQSPLGSNHDSYAQGIYRDTDSNYSD